MKDRFEVIHKEIHSAGLEKSKEKIFGSIMLVLFLAGLFRFESNRSFSYSSGKSILRIVCRPWQPCWY